ncbi:MAG TPA: PE-PPE domain-containing protein [Amycolatopsis sp.]|nr:PE-PPE domain-containing protein [Amycolatopsis sp.]
MKTARLAAAAGAMLAMTLGAPAIAQAATAAQQEHYYIEIGGTWDPDAHNYDLANQSLNGIGVPVHYAASPGPGIPGRQLSYDESVHEGWLHASAVLRQTHRDHPGAHLTVVGYSQGAHVANLVLNDVADGVIDIPKSQVDGKLYADPMQPETSIGAIVPKGMSAFGFTSPGPGRADFGGFPVQRYCINTDGVCDFASGPQAPGGYIAQHPCYPRYEIPATLAQPVVHETTWIAPHPLPACASIPGQP